MRTTDTSRNSFAAVSVSTTRAVHSVTVPAISTSRCGSIAATLASSGRLQRPRPALEPLPVEQLDHGLVSRSGGLVDAAARAMFLRWTWYAARREGLHLDGAADEFSTPERVEKALRRRPRLHQMVPHLEQ